MDDSADAPVDILLVEDNPADARLTREALKETGIEHSLWVVANGEEAMAFLRGEGPFVEMPRPGLVILDLNLPRKDGREVLAEVKADPALRLIPVIVLTTSRSEDDIRRAYDLNANCYVAKPVELNAFLDIVRSIHAFWLSTVTLPPANPVETRPNAP